MCARGAGDGGATPAAVRIAGLLVAMEAAGLTALAAVYLAAVVGGHPASRGVAVFAALLGLAAAGVLARLAAGLRRRSRWSRTPTVLLQLLALPVGIGLVQAGRPGPGLPVLAAATAVLLLLFGSAAAREAFIPR